MTRSGGGLKAGDGSADPPTVNEPRRVERRIGERRLLPPVEVTWDLAQGKLAGPFRKGLPADERVGVIVDASVTGAGMEAVAHKALGDGTQLVLQHEGGVSLVTIVRVGDSDHPGRRRYGLEFVKLDPRLRAAIFSVLGEGRPREDARPFTSPRPPTL